MREISCYSCKGLQYVQSKYTNYVCTFCGNFFPVPPKKGQMILLLSCCSDFRHVDEGTTTVDCDRCCTKLFTDFNSEKIVYYGVTLTHCRNGENLLIHLYKTREEVQQKEEKIKAMSKIIKELNVVQGKVNDKMRKMISVQKHILVKKVHQITSDDELKTLHKEAVFLRETKDELREASHLFYHAVTGEPCSY